MSSPKRRLDLARAAAHKVGEGAIVDVKLRTDAQVEGTTKVSVGVNLDSAPVPDRRYVADAADAVYSDESVKLLFGQKKLGTSELRTLLIISIVPDRVRQFLETVDAMQQPSLNEIIKNLRLDEVSLNRIDSEPEQTTAVVSNIVGAGVSGGETCLDFYHMSPFSILKIQSTHKVALDPVVRVHVRTALFTALMKKLRQMLDELPKGENT